jgi:2-polyprenyl-6-methoxyphenol hydroxylase-like FAD-dependent oxidoreductase
VRKSILVLGGGTAGWMSANLLHHALNPKGFDITVIESPLIGIIGVGEGSTPHIRQLFATLGISEAQWMPQCHATYKNGIRFHDWSSDKHYSDYFHPFPSVPDRQTAAGFLINTMMRRQGHNVESRPDPFFLSAHLATNNLSPKTQAGFPMSINYGYHFDAGKLGEYLKSHAIEQGVTHISANVNGVTNHLSGDIKALITDDGAEHQADWFIDCSGFNSLLLQKNLGVEFIDFADNLFNDSAVAMPSPVTSPIQAQTHSTAMSNGWSWEIPLTNRTGNGYVYSANYISADQAETELRQKLQLLDADVPVKHLKMKVGRVAKHWHKNCLAVGLSQGFIEPLEATALHLVQDSLENFISAFSAGEFSNKHQNEFNQRINQRFEGIRDYIVCHYKVNSRTDSKYWLDNAHNQAISEPLKHIINSWDTGEDLTKTIDNLGVSHFYPAISWYCLLAGYGRFPAIGAAGALSHEVDLQQIQQFIQHYAKGFIPQDIALSQL